MGRRTILGNTHTAVTPVLLPATPAVSLEPASK